MTLSKEDGQLYYKLWLSLLDYVNKKYRINPELKSMLGATLIPFKDVIISDGLVAPDIYADLSLTFYPTLPI
jgi:hypothetical protein